MNSTAKSIVAGCFVGAAMAVAWFVMVMQTSETNTSRSVDLSNDRVNLSIATPSLKPEDVVRLQLRSLQQADTDPEAIVDCYSLAAPSNRELTGPLSRFDALVRSGDYQSLIGHQKALLGRPVLMELTDDGMKPESAVLVTVLDQVGLATSFQFVLQKQDEPPYEDCWMTVSVFPVQVARPGDGSSDGVTSGDLSFDFESDGDE